MMNETIMEYTIPVKITLNHIKNMQEFEIRIKGVNILFISDYIVNGDYIEVSIPWGCEIKYLTLIFGPIFRTLLDEYDLNILVPEWLPSEWIRGTLLEIGEYTFTVSYEADGNGYICNH